MFLRTLSQTRGDRRYKRLKVLESYREGGGVGQRTLLNFGNIDGWPRERLRRLIRLLQVMVGEASALSVGYVKVVSSATYGLGVAVGAMWRSIGMPELIDSCLSDRRPEFDVASALEAMTLNRLVEPKSKLGVSQWLDAHNEDPKVFLWRKDAETILAKVARAGQAICKEPSCALHQGDHNTLVRLAYPPVIWQRPR